MDGPQHVSTREGYDLWSEIYDDDDNALIAVEEPLVRGLLQDVRGSRIADVGCGTGRHAIPLSSAGARMDAYDFSEGMLSRARIKPGAELVNWIEHDITRQLPCADASYDRVLSALVIDHIENLAGFFAELHRICRPDGRIVASVVHPAMLLRGVTARFTNPHTQRETRPAAQRHQISDYVMAVLGSGLHIERLSEHAVDTALAERSERARKYLDWPILFLMELRPGRGVREVCAVGKFE